MAGDAKKIIDFGSYIGGEEAIAEANRKLRALGKTLTDFGKTASDDSGKIKAGLDLIASAITAIQSKAVKLSLVSPEDKKLLNDYIKQVADLGAVQDAYKKAQQAQQLIQQQAQKLQRDSTAAAKEFTSELAKQKEALRAATAANDLAAQKSAATAIRATATASKDLNAALRGSNSALTAAAGSYDELVLRNNKLLASLHGLEGGLQAGSQEAAKLKQQIYDNTETLKLFDTETNRNFRSVGDYKSGFSGLITELAKARATQAGLTQGSQEYAVQQQRIIGFQTAASREAAKLGLSYEQAEAQIEGVTGAIQPLTTNLVRLEREQAAVAIGAGKESEQFRVLGFQIERTKKEINEVAAAQTKVADSSGGLTQQLGFTKDGLQQYAIGLATSAVGLQAIVQGVQAVFQANVQYSRDLAEVRKTTGLSADEADRLAESLKRLDTPTSLQGLLKIAGVGGQLGIAKNDLLDFTKAIDISVQALGNDFSGGAEEIATTLGKLSNVFRKELGPDVAQNILSIGSAVNQLGADGAATAPFLTDVALRVGALSASTGVGLENVLAYAAVLQETGSTSEVAGTALNRFFSTLTTKTKEAYEIAKIANPSLTLKEFTRLVNTDFNQAIQVFLRGLKEGGKSTTEQARLLATLKLQSGEAKNAIVTLAQNTDLFAERQKSANTQLRDATSLAQEAAVNTATLGGEVDKLTNDTKNFFTSGAAGDFLKWLVSITRLLYANTIGAAVQSLGDGISYLSQKAGLSKAPLDDFAAGIGLAASAAYKQAAAQQALLDSYKKLDGMATRTAAQEKELSDLRTKLGSADVEALQKNIDTIQQRGDGIKEQLKRDLAGLTSEIGQTTLKLAADQDALGLQARRLTAEQLAQVKQVAQARLDANSPLTGKSSNPALEGAISQATRLLKAERELAEQQRNRANILAALSKLEGTGAQTKKDAADAAEEEEKAEAQLDRTAQQRAKNRAQALRDALADNQKRIDAAKAYQAEQGRLFAAGQLSSETFAESVAGSQDLITQYERDGTALRIKIVKAESAEKLEEASNDRIRQSKKKNISEAELADIQGQYALRRVEIARKEKREIAAINDEASKRQGAVEPLEFKPVQVDYDAILRARNKVRLRSYETELAEITRFENETSVLLTGQRARREISQEQYDERQRINRKNANDRVLELDKKFHKDTLDDQRKGQPGRA